MNCHVPIMPRSSNTISRVVHFLSSLFSFHPQDIWRWRLLQHRQCVAPFKHFMTFLSRWHFTFSTLVFLTLESGILSKLHKNIFELPYRGWFKSPAIVATGRCRKRELLQVNRLYIMSFTTYKGKRCVASSVFTSYTLQVTRQTFQGWPMQVPVMKKGERET